ncbi:conserved protein of unknown function [Candidatus Hydrogenisulfobacillus filiaventi]|uniref:Uncharacterized protein n=1 Tax=Candidatus Hydrogenisulfobacillus filiaventi TaxID=2707344 RepID=A0A6F8ZJW7_9FIRM|nr:hypothetical protein [Bacillota bacterium]CAB1129743.1 conserved protein of unknown function [Candidatus Hydrogenisulfobacillus filiaventi]
MARLISDDVRSQIVEFFKGLKDPVTIEIYRGPQAELADVMVQLAQELAETTDRLSVRETDQVPELEPFHAKPLTEITGPVSVLLDHRQQPTGVRYLGLPSGHEFGAFLEDIRDISNHTVGLSQGAKDKLATLTRPVHIQVFTTPT